MRNSAVIRKAPGAVFIMLILYSAFRIYSVLNGCQPTLVRYLKMHKDMYQGKMSIIYVIKSVNECCRRCYEYDKYKESNLRIVFFVEKDFSDVDIKNFRRVFGIADHHTIHKIDGDIEKVCHRCSLSFPPSNLSILIDSKARLFDVVRF